MDVPNSILWMQESAEEKASKMYGSLLVCDEQTVACLVCREEHAPWRFLSNSLGKKLKAIFWLYDIGWQFRNMASL